MNNYSVILLFIKDLFKKQTKVNATIGRGKKRLKKNHWTKIKNNLTRMECN